MDEISAMTIGSAFGVLLAVLWWNSSASTNDHQSDKAKDTLAKVMLSSAWAYGVVPNWINVSEVGREPALTNTVRAISGTGQTMGQIFLLLVALTATALLILTIKAKSSATLSALGLMLAPFILLNLSGVINDGGYSVYALIAPLVITALFRAQIRIIQLNIIAHLTIALACMSLIMGVLVPDVGTTEPPIQGGKQVWDSLLAGPHSHPNVLGLALSLGLPFLPYVKRAWLRYGGLLMIAIAIIWSGNRNSILAAVVVLVSWAFLAKYKSALYVWCLAILAAMMVIATPLLSRSQSDYSFRGRIWVASLERAEQAPVLGLGPRFYQLVARYRNELGQTAFSGHNAMVHIVTTGGILTLVAIGVLMIVLVRDSISLLQASYVPALFVIGTLFNSWLQNPATLSGIDVMSYVYLMPIAIILFARNFSEYKTRKENKRIGDRHEVASSIT